jgi:hypothetical protein
MLNTDTRSMTAGVRRRFKRAAVAGVAAAAVLASTAAPTAEAKPRSPVVTPLATFGSGLGSGSTIGPDGALYVTDGNAGAVWRIDRRTGAVSLFADGLPPQVLGIGGAMDVAFIGHTAYVLVTMVGGDIVGGEHFGDATDGIYRLNRDGSFTVIADIGAFSAANPPATDDFITTGVQYAMQPIHRGFLVTDGHHNRVLRVALDGDVSELVTFGNIVPTGLDVSGNTVYLSRLGPIPHVPEDGRILSFTTRGQALREVARGASMTVDVELGRHHTVYALSQGNWNGEGEGSPAFPDSGRLVRAEHGNLEPLHDAAGNELVLDRPTSFELVGDTAYVVSLAGNVVKVDNYSEG